MLRKALALAVLAAAALVSQARADIVLSFSNTGSTAPAAFQVVVGQTINVPVFLVETTNPPSSGGILAREGLLSGGVRLNYPTVAGSATVTAATLNPQFTATTN